MQVHEPVSLFVLCMEKTARKNAQQSSPKPRLCFFPGSANGNGAVFPPPLPQAQLSLPGGNGGHRSPGRRSRPALLKRFRIQPFCPCPPRPPAPRYGGGEGEKEPPCAPLPLPGGGRGLTFRCGEAAAARTAPAPAPARRARTAMALEPLPLRGTAPLLSGAGARGWGWGAEATPPVGGR